MLSLFFFVLYGREALVGSPKGSWQSMLLLNSSCVTGIELFFHHWAKKQNCSATSHLLLRQSTGQEKKKECERNPKAKVGKLRKPMTTAQTTNQRTIFHCFFFALPPSSTSLYIFLLKLSSYSYSLFSSKVAHTFTYTTSI